MKRASEHDKEEILRNKKIKHDNRQDVSTNEASSLTDDENNFKEKKSLSDTDEGVFKSSFEGIQEKTISNSSPSTETEEEGATTGVGSVSNHEIVKINDAIQSPIETKQHSLEDVIRSYMETLKEGVADKDTYDHIIALILKIYTECRSYTVILKQIIEDVEGIEGENETFESLCGLASSIAGYNRDISNMFDREVTEDEVEWEDMIAGKVYDSICDIYL